MKYPDNKKRHLKTGDIRNPIHYLVTLNFLIFNCAYHARDQRYSKTKDATRTLLCTFDRERHTDYTLAN